MLLTISGVQTAFAQISIGDQLDARSTARITIINTGASYLKGQPVIITDDVNGYRVFKGFIEAANVFCPYASDPTRVYTLTCVDQHYLADKRIVAKTYSNFLAGDIVQDIITNILINEGITGTRATPVFARASVTYQLNGSQVASGAQRYETVGGVTGVIYEKSTTNLLSANQSSVETDTTGFTGVNGTLTRITTDFWTGTACLQIVTTSTSADSGFTTNNISGTAGTTYTCSTWVKALAGSLLKLVAKDNTNSVTTTVNFTATGSWQRVSATVVYGAATGTGLQLKILTQGAQPIVTILADGMQIEAQTYATTWITGGVTRQGDNLSVASQAVWQVSEGAAVARVYFEAKQHTSSGDRYIFHMDNSGNNRISLYHAAGTSNWRLTLTDAAGAAFNLSVADQYTADGWHTIGMRWNATECAIFWDGVKIATGAPTHVPAAMQTTLYVGVKGASGGSQYDSYINSVYFAYMWLSDALMTALTSLTSLAYDDTASYVIQFGTGAMVRQTPIFDGPSIVTTIFNYPNCDAAISALAQKADYFYVVDHYGLVRFGPRTARPAPFAGLMGVAYGVNSIALDGSINHENSAPKYRNAEYLIGGTDLTNSQIEIQTGDGQKQTFTMGFALAQVPTVEVSLNGAAYVAQTVGIKGVDTGKQWYWAQGDPSVYQDASGTKLLAVDKIRVTYIGIFPIIIYANDQHAAALRAVAEGQGTGIVEVAEIAPADVTSRTQGYADANALLARYGVIGNKLTFKTYNAGLKPGQVINVTCAEYNIAANTQYLIDTVQVSNPNEKQVVYDITAYSGPITGSWVEYFKLTSSIQTQIDQVNLGSATVLTVLESVTETWTWTETITETVLTCPICGPSTLCSGTTIVC